MTKLKAPPEIYNNIPQYEDAWKTDTFAYAKFRSLQFAPDSNRTLNITHAGEEQCLPGHYYDELRTENHLHFILHGKGTFQVEGRVYRLKRGDAFVVPEGCQNHYQADWSDPWHYTWVSFSGSCAWSYLEAVGFSREALTRPAFAPPEQYYGYIRNIIEASRLTHANELHRMSGLYAVFALLARSRLLQDAAGREKTQPCPIAPHVNQAIQYLQSNYKTTNIEETAKYVGLNRSYLTTLFKQQMKMTPQQYLIRIRMEKAGRLLETTVRPIGEIAAAVGYEEALTFTKVFHRTYGMSPRDYRKMKSVELPNRGNYCK